jgi:uncharacterized membrane protein YraQ (UPF0718 family)
MLSAYLTLGILLIALAALAERRGGVSHREVAAEGIGQALSLLLRIPAALLAGSFLAELVPAHYVVTLLGDASGATGVLVASALGGLLPGGPMIAFPLLLVLYKAGMGIPQMIALLTAWLVLAFHRILVYELPMLGRTFVWRRLLASLPLPLAAGLAAEVVGRLL